MAPETDCHLDQQNIGVLFLASAGVGVLYRGGLRALSTSGQGGVSPICWGAGCL